MKIAVTGANGMLGRAVCNAVCESGYECIPLGRNKCDITSKFNVRRSLEHADSVINCAGIIPTEFHKSTEYIEVNSLGPWVLSENFSGHIVQVSTDCVFSGLRRCRPYDIYDLPDADSLYGRSKAAGEVKSGNVTVVRTSFIGFEHGLLDWMLRHKCKAVNGYEAVLWSGSTVYAVARELVKIACSNPSTVQHLALENPITKAYLLNLLNALLGLDCKIQTVHCPVVNLGLEPTIVLPKIEDSIEELKSYLCKYQ